LADRAVEASQHQPGCLAHALHLLGDISSHPNGTLRAATRTTRKRWHWLRRGACVHSLPIAISGAADSTHARARASWLGTTLLWRRRCTARWTCRLVRARGVRATRGPIYPIVPPSR
jgi:hypothetical protein